MVIFWVFFFIYATFFSKEELFFLYLNILKLIDMDSWCYYYHHYYYLLLLFGGI